jgi:hypothetical protein
MKEMFDPNHGLASFTTTWLHAHRVNKRDRRSLAGGQGAPFAGELAPSYDGALVLSGVAAIAPVSNADLLAPLIPGHRVRAIW